MNAKKAKKLRLQAAQLVGVPHFGKLKDVYKDLKKMHKEGKIQ